MGMENIASLNRASETTIHTTRELIHDESFCRRHRTSDKHFTRRRKLPFVNVMVMLLQKTVRSIQLHLHGFFAALAPVGQSATASSWCEARLKLKHTAFIELNERAILGVAYGGQKDFAVRLWKGHRLIGLDSSLIRLPNELALGREFGWMESSNRQGSDLSKSSVWVRRRSQFERLFFRRDVTADLAPIRRAFGGPLR